MQNSRRAEAARQRAEEERRRAAARQRENDELARRQMPKRRLSRFHATRCIPAVWHRRWSALPTGRFQYVPMDWPVYW